MERASPISRGCNSTNGASFIHQGEALRATAQATERQREGNLGECCWLFFVSAFQRDGRADFVQTMLTMIGFVVLALSLITATLIEFSCRNPVMKSERREGILTERV
jgi:hypothetical protein